MFNPAYRIITKNLIIRCYNPVDAVLLERSVSESLDHLLPWMPWAGLEPEPFFNKVERLRRMRSNFDLNIDFVFGIFNLGDDFLIGGTGLHPRIGNNALEIGYWIHKEYINKGLAAEASAALTKVAFEVNKVERTEIHCAVENIRSAAIPRKLGYMHEANLLKRGFSHGKTCDQMIWTLFASQYPTSLSSKMDCAVFDAAERRIL